MKLQFDASVSDQMQTWCRSALGVAKGKVDFDFLFSGGTEIEADDYIITVSVVPEPSCPGHQDYMCAHLDGKIGTIEIREGADQPESVQLPAGASVRTFFMESFIHEMAHLVTFASVDTNAKIERMAGMFRRVSTGLGWGGARGNAADWNPLDKPWEERIQEAVAEVLKDDVMPESQRVYENRTMWEPIPSNYSSIMDMLLTPLSTVTNPGEGELVIANHMAPGAPYLLSPWWVGGNDYRMIFRPDIRMWLDGIPDGWTGRGTIDLEYDLNVVNAYSAYVNPDNAFAEEMFLSTAILANGGSADLDAHSLFTSPQDAPQANPPHYPFGSTEVWHYSNGVPKDPDLAGQSTSKFLLGTRMAREELAGPRTFTQHTHIRFAAATLGPPVYDDPFPLPRELYYEVHWQADEVTMENLTVTVTPEIAGSGPPPPNLGVAAGDKSVMRFSSAPR